MYVSVLSHDSRTCWRFVTEGARTPLILASLHGHMEVCKVLIAADADVEAVDKADKTPLAYAASRGHREIAKLLLDHGAEIEATDCIVRDMGCSVL